MTVLVLGGTGLLGQAMTKELRSRGRAVITAARRDADININVANLTTLALLLEQEHPAIVINCIALVDVDACEQNPGLAWATNARPLSVIAEWARNNDRPFIHVSTDQYFMAGGSTPHAEDAEITVTNEYARSKYVAEALALTAKQALVLRTSIVGIRGWAKPTFAEWAIDVAEYDKAAALFRDAFTSSIDVRSFSRASLDLLEKGAHGLYNLSASEVYTKEQFVREVARQLGKRLSNATAGSVASMATRRANCLGLDVAKATSMLGYTLPSLQQVVASVLTQYREKEI